MLQLHVRRGGNGREVVGEGAGDGQQLLGLDARGDPEAVHLAGDHPGAESHPRSTAGAGAGGLHLDAGGRHGARRRAEGEVLRGVVPRIDAHQCDQVAEALDEDGVGIQAGGSWEGSEGKLPIPPQLRNYPGGGPNRAART